MDDEIVALPNRKEDGKSATLEEGPSREGREACGWLLSGDSAEEPLRALPWLEAMVTGTCMDGFLSRLAPIDVVDPERALLTEA